MIKVTISLIPLLTSCLIDFPQGHRTPELMRRCFDFVAQPFRAYSGDAPVYNQLNARLAERCELSVESPLGRRLKRLRVQLDEAPG